MRRMLCHVVLLGSIALLAGPAAAEDEVLGEIIIEGNTRTDRAVIERIIAVRPGDPWDLETLDDVWDRLEDSGYFAFVDLDDRPDSQGRVTLRVEVEEEKTFRATPYLRYDRRHKYLLGGAIEDTNVRGKGEVLTARAIALYIQQARAGWTKPWLAGVDGLTLDVHVGWEQGPFVFRPFDYQLWRAAAGLRKDVTDAFYVELGGGHTSLEQEDDYAWPVDGAPMVRPAETRGATHVRALIGYDTRPSPYYPTSGAFGTLEYRYRHGDAVRRQGVVTGDLRLFQRVLGDPIVALRAFGTMADPVDAPEYFLYWGGPETVRGAPYASREGNTAYLLTAEVRYPLALMRVSQAGEVVGLGLHAFTDVGDAWFRDRAPHSDLELPDDSPNSAWVSYGAGVHLNLLTWQLRFEAAKELDHDWTFQFMDVFNF